MSEELSNIEEETISLSDNWGSLEETAKKEQVVEEEKVSSPAAIGGAKKAAKVEKQPSPKKAFPTRSTTLTIDNALPKGGGYVVNGKLVTPDGAVVK
jgi:hypothetical protein